MADKIFNSTAVTFVDMTDSRILDVYITSNHPTVQICDSNKTTSKYTPDWSVTPLTLEGTCYLDASSITPTKIEWYTKIGTTETLIGSSAKISITRNVLSDNPIITYICKATYDTITAYKEITFTRVDTGKNGSDGTSVKILGTAKSVKQAEDNKYYEITYDEGVIKAAAIGDAYVFQGELYVCSILNGGTDGLTDYFVNVGSIQGPAGQDAKSIILSGDSQVFKVAKTSTSTTPNTITINAIPVNISDANNIIWSYKINSSTSWLNLADGAKDIQGGIDRTGNQVVVTGKDLTNTITSITFKASYGSIEDIFTIYKASDGIDGNKGDPAPLVFLTNENITFPADAQGEIAGSTIFQTKVVGYIGDQKVLPELNTNADGTINFLGGLPSYLTASYYASGTDIIIQFTIKDKTLGSTSNTSGEISIPITSPINTYLPLNWSKVNAGVKGEKGNDGVNAYTVLLTNESHVFAGGVDSALAGTAETQVLAYLGSTQQKVKILEVNGQSAATIKTNVEGVTGLQFECDTISEADSPKITFTCTTAFKGKTNGGGTIPIKLSVGSAIFTKMFTYSIAFKGSTGGTGAQGLPGENSTSYWLVSSASVVQKTSTGTITVTPSTLTFTSKSQSGTNPPISPDCRWTIESSDNGTTYTTRYTSSKDESSITFNVATTYKTIRVRMYMAGDITVLLDEQIIPIVSDGIPGTSASFVDVTPSAYFFKSTTGKDGVFTPDYIYLYPRFQTVTYSKWQYYNDSTSSWADIVSGSNGLTIGTYNSTANSLQISKNSSLYTDSITSVSFKCVSSNTAVYDTVSIAKIYDVVDLQIGGRNLALETSTPVTATNDGTKTVTSLLYKYASKEIGEELDGKEVTISFDYDNKITSGSCYCAIYYSWQGICTFGTTNTGKNKMKVTLTLTDTVHTDNLVAYLQGTYTGTITISNFKIEKGNKATDWTPAPEDLINEASNVNVMLSNEAHFFEANASGVPTATSIVLDVFGYKGSIQSNTTVGTITGLPSTGMTATIVSNNTTSTKITINVTSALTSSVADSGVLTIPVTVNGHTINKKFSWSKSKEGAVGTPGSDAVTFRIYSTEGYVLSMNTQNITLQTFAYVGDTSIASGATYQWYQYNGDWNAITGATNNYLSISRSDVAITCNYMCKMQFEGNEYADVVTIEDKGDANKVFTTKPKGYSVGDIWIVGGDYQPKDIIFGTLLKATADNTSYSDNDWVIATKYDETFNNLQKDINNYNQHFSFTANGGVQITAKDENNNLSPYSTTLSSEKLSFNYGNNEIASISGTKMKIKEADVESPLTITGKYSGTTMLQAPTINIGGFSIIVESNGSLSIVVH